LLKNQQQEKKSCYKYNINILIKYNIMYFRLIDHYPDYSENVMEDDPTELNECLICLEIITHDNLRPIDLKTQNVFLKKCDCGGWVHLCCLYKWYEINNSCPICRLYMKKSESLISILSFKFENFCSKFISAVIRVYFVFWFMFAIACSYHIYQSYFILNTRNHNDKGEYIIQ
jgi:hypothetical protein